MGSEQNQANCGILNTSIIYVSGPDLDDCNKNGKKAAEAMSLSKEGKCIY